MSGEPGTDVAVDGADATRRRGLLERSLTTRFGLRLHMSLMLAAAFSVGFMSNFIMLRAGLSALLLRWILAYCIGYLVLFVAMRFWLAYVGVRPFSRGSGGSALDAGDGYTGPIAWPSGGRSSGGGAFRGGGGRFGGGGASGGFDGKSVAASVGSHGGSKGLGIGDIFGGDDSGKLLLLIAVVVAILAAFGGGIVFLVVSAPHLLVDVAFGAAITSGMAPAAKRVAVAPQWEGSVWHATWKPAVVMLVVLIVCALVFHHFFPGMRTLGEAFTALH
ncbi:MAG: hypothetical protein ABI881_10425 [Betaproteobacteria bacterium]